MAIYCNTRTRRYISGPGIGNFKQVQKLPNVETFGLKNIPFLEVLPLLATSITRCLMNAQHSMSDSLMMLPKLATSIIHSQPYYISLWVLVSIFGKFLNFCQIWQA